MKRRRFQTSEPETAREGVGTEMVGIAFAPETEGSEEGRREDRRAAVRWREV